ncbi:hypothetical protein H6504_02715 [Candidatus Woesearchaeota archaeon]|nr:hypothetical protein [Candidatus Woesearchaeota archaeon]
MKEVKYSILIICIILILIGISAAFPQKDKTYDQIRTVVTDAERFTTEPIYEQGKITSEYTLIFNKYNQKIGYVVNTEDVRVIYDTEKKVRGVLVGTGYTPEEQTLIKLAVTESLPTGHKHLDQLANNIQELSQEVIG